MHLLTTVNDILIPEALLMVDNKLMLLFSTSVKPLTQFLIES